MHLLIDSDSLCYRAGFVCNQPGQENLACWQLEKIVEGVLEKTGCFSYELFLSGSDNFRYKLYPEYKGNRADMLRPIHLQVMREFLVTKYKASVSCGIEADDAVGIAAYKHVGPVVMSHIDKDLDQFAGEHYNYVKETWYSLSELDGMKNLYKQMVLGDKADNIPGFDGKMRPKCPKFLQYAMDEIDMCDDEKDMFTFVFDMYNEDVGRFSTSMHMLYLQRHEGDEWENPLGMGGFAQSDVINRLELMKHESNEPTESTQL